jgi:hypothetical protein
VSERSEIFLGIIAAATVALALVQIGVILVAGLAVRRATKLIATIEEELRPIFGHVNAIARDASRAAALATAQVERADQLFADLAVRVERAMNDVQASIGRPAREGRALMSAFKAAFQAIREMRHSGRGRQARSEDEDALFI